jgi:hypothetical protein
MVLMRSPKLCVTWRTRAALTLADLYFGRAHPGSWRSSNSVLLAPLRLEQPFDAVSAIKIERQLNPFIDGKARSRHIAGTTTDAIGAMVRWRSLSARLSRARYSVHPAYMRDKWLFLLSQGRRYARFVLAPLTRRKMRRTSPRRRESRAFATTIAALRVPSLFYMPVWDEPSGEDAARCSRPGTIPELARPKTPAV